MADYETLHVDMSGTILPTMCQILVVTQLNLKSLKNCICHFLVLSHSIGRWQHYLPKTPDTPQFRGGNPYFFSENPYTSVSFIYASIFRENVHAIHIAMQFAKKSRHCVIKIDSQQQITKIGALLHVVRQSD